MLGDFGDASGSGESLEMLGDVGESLEMLADIGNCWRC